MFIDDLFGDTAAPHEHQVIGRITVAAASLHRVVSEELRCEVALHKSMVVASIDGLLSKVTKAFGRFAGVAAQSAPNLGVDYYAARRRAHRKSTLVIRGRHGKFLKRARKLRALQRAGCSMNELYKTGLQAYAHYGAEVVGLNPKKLKQSRSQYSALAGSPARSPSSALTFCLERGPDMATGAGTYTYLEYHRLEVLGQPHLPEIY